MPGQNPALPWTSLDAGLTLDEEEWFIIIMKAR
jgi:hypothetical protein